MCERGRVACAARPLSRPDYRDVMLRHARWTTGLYAITLLLGGSVLTASAVSSPGASQFVPIAPCRLLDTRPKPDNVGSRATPITAGDTFNAAVWGTNGNCTIPSTATAVSMNVTVIGPTAASFLTVFPTDKPKPLAANLTWVANQAPTPNAVTSALASTGSVSFFNLAGTVNVAADIVGYYEPVGAGAPGPRPSGIVWVAKSGGDFTSVRAALASITDNGPNHPYVVKIAPGTYDEEGGVDAKSYVDLEGSGEGITTITCSCGGPISPVTDGTSATLRVAGGDGFTSHISRLAVSNAGPSAYETAIWIHPAAPNTTWTVRFDHVTADASGGQADIGLFNLDGTITVSYLTATSHSTGSESWAIANYKPGGGNSSADYDHVTAFATGDGTDEAAEEIGMYNVRFFVDVDTVSARTTGIQKAYAIYNDSSDFFGTRVDAINSGGLSNGMFNDNGALVNLTDSNVSAVQDAHGAGTHLAFSTLSASAVDASFHCRFVASPTTQLGPACT
jgi:hypothetical protein